MHPLKQIIVGVDFSECSKVALAQAVRIARWNDAALEVLHVIDELVVHELQGALKDLSPERGIRADVLSSGTERVNEMIAAAGSSADSISADVVIGNPFAALAGRVRDRSCELLILGATGASGRRHGAGTLATRCVRKAAANVLLVRGEQAGPVKHIVACVDFSDTSAQVIEYALRAAKREGATLHVIHVFAAPWNVLHYRAPTLGSSPDFQQQYKDSLNACLERLLRPFDDDLRQLDVQTHLFESTYQSAEILRFVETCTAELVIVGVRGRTGLKGILLGSTAENVVRESPCSVLAIKPQDFEYDIG